MRIVTTRRTMVAVIVLLSLLLSTTFIYCSSSSSQQQQQQYTLFLKKASKSSSALHASNYHIAQGHHFHTRTLSNTPAVESLQDYPVGWVEFNDTIQSTGWATLQVKTSDQHDNEHQSFGAGYLEGFATAHLIGPYWNAFKEYNYNNTLKASFDQFMTKQFQYMENKVFDQQKGKSSVDPFQKQFWNQVGLILAQVKGIKSGYEQRRNANPDSLIEMSFLDVLKFQYNVDAPDIEQSFSPTDLSHMNRDEISLFALLHSKCSALVKYTSDRSNLLMTHSTWDTFANQLRVYKHFELNFHESNDALPVRQASKLVSFSSTPGWITSADDFYITSNGLMVTETTNNIFTQSLYKYVTPTTVPYWIRNAVANRMANNAPEWTKYFAMENSGTYNNQWMIVDTNKFVAGSSKSHPDMFHVLEQIPGKITTGSASEQLDQLGYWASYNIPFYPDIYNASGYPEMVRKHGDEWTHDHCPRANIFREFQNSAQDVESLKPVIRRNEWQNDPFALGDACNQIAARCDLNPPQASHYRAFGQIDAKVTDIKLVKQMKAVAQNGPTHSGTNKPFSWVNNHFENTVSHVLQPNTFNFGYEAMQPKYPFPSK